MTHRLQTDDGANAVEFALVLPILVILLFGIFTVGMSYEAKLSLSHGARDAARYGATLPFTSVSGDIPDSWFVDIKDRALAAATGQLADDGTNGSFICISYIETVLDDPSTTTTDESYSKVETSTWDDSPGSPKHDGTTPCYTDTIPTAPVGTGNAHVQVRLQRDTTIDIVMVPVLRPQLTADSVVRFEHEPTSEGA